MTSLCRSKKESGFTLIEILIVMAIMAFISVQTFQILTGFFALRKKLDLESDFYNNINLAMNVVKRDIEMSFSPKMMIPAKKPPTAANPQNPDDPNANDPALATAVENQNLVDQVKSEFWGKILDPTGIRSARFYGKDQYLGLITTSHIRVYRESIDSVFAKVEFFLQPDKDAKDDLAGTFVLAKTENTNAFDMDSDDDPSKIYYPLLEGIQEFEINYYKHDKGQWVKSWDSNGLDDEERDRIPRLVRIKLRVKGHNRLEFDGDYRFKPEFPNEDLSASL